MGNWPVIESRLNNKGNKFSINRPTPRFFVNNFGNQLAGGSNANSNLFIRTLVYIATSTTTVASISKCIPASQFAAGSSNVACAARKRREILELLDEIAENERNDVSTPTAVQRYYSMHTLNCTLPITSLRQSGANRNPQSRRLIRISSWHCFVKR